MKQGNFLPIVAAALVVLALAGLIIFKLPFQKLSAPPATPTVSQSGLPSLYPKAEWGEAKAGNYLFPSKETVAIEKSGYWIETKSTVSTPNDLDFFKYYKTELEKYGWQEYEIADGPDGGVRTYKRGEGYYMVMTKAIASTPTNFKLIIVYTK